MVDDREEAAFNIRRQTMSAMFFRSLQSLTYVRRLTIALDILSPYPCWNRTNM